MILNKVISKKYQGHILQNYYLLTGTPLGWEGMKVFKKIPYKVSIFIKKKLIKEIRQYKLQDDYSINQYFIKTVNNKIYELIY